MKKASRNTLTLICMRNIVKNSRAAPKNLLSRRRPAGTRCGGGQREVKLPTRRAHWDKGAPRQDKK